jgi:O-methyltransferase
MKDVGGDVAEVGVYQGGSAEELVKCFPGRLIHLFDTFTGIPDTVTEFDGTYKPGDHNETSYELVKKRFEKYDNVRIHPGVFPQTAESLNGEKFCFVNIDVDIYQSMKDCWEFFYPRLSGGGIFYIEDDYGSPSTPGVKKATDEFLADKPEKIREFTGEPRGVPTILLRRLEVEPVCIIKE